MRHEFVEYVPEELEEGVVYVSIPFATAVHKCACGCGKEVVTPLSPRDWKLTFDGESISLHPSIGNWSFPCRSHYWIRNDRLKWAATWSEEEIESRRTRDRSNESRLSEQKNVGLGTRPHDELDARISGRAPPVAVTSTTTRDGLWIRIMRWWGSP